MVTATLLYNICIHIIEYSNLISEPNSPYLLCGSTCYVGLSKSGNHTVILESKSEAGGRVPGLYIQCSSYSLD